MRTVRDEDDHDTDEIGPKVASLGQARAVHETDRALLVEIEGEDESVWIPKSVIHDDSEVFSCDEGENEGDLIVKRWWAKKEGRA